MAIITSLCILKCKNNKLICVSYLHPGLSFDQTHWYDRIAFLRAPPFLYGKLSEIDIFISGKPSPSDRGASLLWWLEKSFTDDKLNIAKI
jgi:hypothetical protein